MAIDISYLHPPFWFITTYRDLCIASSRSLLRRLLQLTRGVHFRFGRLLWNPRGVEPINGRLQDEDTMQDRRAPRKEADRRTSSPDRVSTVRARAADTHVALVDTRPISELGVGRASGYIPRQD